MTAVIRKGKADKELLGLIQERSTDLLVMGAYGHSPVREVLFGSTTEKVLSHCSASVVLQS